MYLQIKLPQKRIDFCEGEKERRDLRSEPVGVETESFTGRGMVVFMGVTEFSDRCGKSATRLARLSGYRRTRMHVHA